jgi:hypothetical protein
VVDVDDEPAQMVARVDSSRHKPVCQFLGTRKGRWVIWPRARGTPLVVLDVVSPAVGPPVSIVTEVEAPDDVAAGGLVRMWRDLSKPLSGAQCLASWLLATGIFFGLVALLGGPSPLDAVESLYPTWAIAHGSFACSYPPANSATNSFQLLYQPFAATPPLWPLISGGLSALTGIGHAVPFPTQHALGAECANGYVKMYRWSLASSAMSPTIDLGYASWIALLAGFIALLRAAGRGRTRWEALGVVFLALVPISWMPLLFEYHPQDLVALGLGLAGTACALRRQWIWAGVLVGLAITSQQFALLILVPILIVAPGRNRWRFLFSSALPVVLVSVPFLIATSGRAIHAVLVGTGDSGGRGGTVLWNLLSQPGFYGSRPTAALLFCARTLPIAVSVALAWWALRRLGPRALDPIPLLSLIATCLSMRLVFEEGLFGYKFLALAVLLIILDIVRGRIRGQLLAWLALVTMAFNPILDLNKRWWAHDTAIAIPLTCIAIVLFVIVRDAVHHRIRWYLVPWFAIAAWAFLRWPPWLPNGLPASRPIWFWQVVLVSSGVVMAASPLVKSITGGSRSRSPAKVDV